MLLGMDLPVEHKKRRALSLRNCNPGTQDSNDTRELLLRTAKTLFANKGFDGTTVKDIADHAQVNISLISYHFEGKEGLYRTCLEMLGKARLAASERVLQTPRSVEEFKVRLEMFTAELLNAHVEEPELSRIVGRECDMGVPIARDIFQNTFLKIYKRLVDFFADSQKMGIVRADLDIDITVGVLFGGLIQIGQKDEINEHFFNRTIKNPKYLAKVVRHSLSFFFQGCIQNPSQILKNKLPGDSKISEKTQRHVKVSHTNRSRAKSEPNK